MLPTALRTPTARRAPPPSSRGRPPPASRMRLPSTCACSPLTSLAVPVSLLCRSLNRLSEQFEHDFGGMAPFVLRPRLDRSQEVCGQPHLSVTSEAKLRRAVEPGLAVLDVAQVAPLDEVLVTGEGGGIAAVGDLALLEYVRARCHVERVGDELLDDQDGD